MLRQKGLSLLGSSFPLWLRRFQQIGCAFALLECLGCCKRPCRYFLCLHTNRYLLRHNFLTPSLKLVFISKVTATVDIVLPMFLPAWHSTTSPRGSRRVATHPRNCPNLMSSLFLHHTLQASWHLGRLFRAKISLVKPLHFHLCSAFCPLTSYFIQFPAIRCCFPIVSAMTLERLYRSVQPHPYPLFLSQRRNSIPSWRLFSLVLLCSFEQTMGSCLSYYALLDIALIPKESKTLLYWKSQAWFPSRYFLIHHLFLSILWESSSFFHKQWVHYTFYFLLPLWAHIAPVQLTTSPAINPDLWVSSSPL